MQSFYIRQVTWKTCEFSWWKGCGGAAVKRCGERKWERSTRRAIDGNPSSPELDCRSDIQIEWKLQFILICFAPSNHWFQASIGSGQFLQCMDLVKCPSPLQSVVMPGFGSNVSTPIFYLKSWSWPKFIFVTNIWNRLKASGSET